MKIDPYNHKKRYEKWKEKVINKKEDSISVDLKKLMYLIIKRFEFIKNISENNFIIKEITINDKKKAIWISGFHEGYDATSSYKKMFSFPISFKYGGDSLINFTSLDLFKIFNEDVNSDIGKKNVLNYLQKKVKYFELLNSRSSSNSYSRSYHALKERKDGLNKNKDSREKGYQFETYSNDLLKAIFQTHIYIGGDNNPDGILILDNSQIITDSKSKKIIESKEDIECMCGYIKGNPFDLDILNLKEKRGLFIIDFEVLESPNLENVLKRAKRDRIEISYVSIDFLLELFEIVQNHTIEFLISPSLKEKIKTSSFELIKMNAVENLYKEVLESNKQTKPSKKIFNSLCLDTIKKNEEKILEKLRELFSPGVLKEMNIKKLQEKYKMKGGKTK